MREHLYKGKTNTGKWITGSLVYSKNISPAIYIESVGGRGHKFDWAYVQEDTVCSYAGVKTVSGKHIFENDICFYEQAEDHGDIRTYMVMKWVEEWRAFCWFHNFELMDYEAGGVDQLEDGFNMFADSQPEMFYAGSYIDKPELLDL